MNQNPREPLLLPSLSIQLKDREKGSGSALLSDADRISANLQPRQLIKDIGDKVWPEWQRSPGSPRRAARQIPAVSAAGRRTEGWRGREALPEDTAAGDLLLPKPSP